MRSPDEGGALGLETFGSTGVVDTSSFGGVGGEGASGAGAASDDGV